MATTDSEVRELKKQLNDLSDQIKEMSSKKFEQVKEEASDHLENSKEKMEEISENLQKKYKIATEKAKDLKEDANNYAHEKPWQTAAMFAVAGLVVGMILGKDKRND